ncbi:MAG: endonuclease [Muribaculaceae bacterium]|nr:endonuclease [Muribaculaceae bacterium]
MNSGFTFKSLAAALLTIVALSATAAVPSGYYDQLEGLSGVSLKKAVKNAAKSHTVIEYGTSTWQVFFETDTRMVGGQKVWWDMYSNNNVAAPNYNSHSGMNIEHSVANSWWGGTKNEAYKDIHHLNPSDSEANNRKSNFPLGIVSSVSYTNDVTIVGKPKSGTCGGAPNVYEPCDEYKGDFARVFFYMFTIYDDIQWSTLSDRNFMYNKSSDLLLQPWAYEMLLEWSKNDPVSQKERDRNEMVYKHQKNRNPFIDYPELADHIWGSKKNTPFHMDGYTGPDPGTDPGTDPTPDKPGNDVPAGYWYAVTSSADLNEDDRYIVVAPDFNLAMSYESGGKFQQVCGASPTLDNSVSPARISDVPKDVAVLSLTRSGAGWTISVSDLSGNHKGYFCCTTAKTLQIVSDPSVDGTTASISPSSASTKIEFKSGSGTLQYNEAAPRFLTYTSSQKPVMLYRLEEVKENPGVDTGIDATGLDENADEVVVGIFDIQGRKVAAEAVSELPRGIYILVTNFGTRKIAI